MASDTDGGGEFPGRGGSSVANRTRDVVGRPRGLRRRNLAPWYRGTLDSYRQEGPTGRSGELGMAGWYWVGAVAVVAGSLLTSLGGES